MGVAQTKAAEGEIPWAFRAGTPHRFVDLQGDSRTFATLDYSQSKPKVFLGHELTLDELELSDTGWSGGTAGGFDQAGEKRVSALAINCPHCAGALQLHAPDETKRVSCPNCASLLDCDHGKLEYLRTPRTRRKRPVIPLGTSGTLNGVEYLVIGFMERVARYQGIDFPWTEYLLKSKQSDYRWLVRNKRHWSFVEPLSAHGVVSSHHSAKYKNEDFRIYDRGTATVRFVLGEFYWKVEVGDEVQTADYINPPRMLSSERSGAPGSDLSPGSQELNISLGTYLTPEQVEEAFGVENPGTAIWRGSDSAGSSRR